MASETFIRDRVWERIFPPKIGDYVIVKGAHVSSHAPEKLRLTITKVICYGKILGIGYEYRNPLAKNSSRIKDSGIHYFDMETEVLRIIRKEDYGKN